MFDHRLIQKHDIFTDDNKSVGVFRNIACDNEPRDHQN